MKSLVYISRLLAFSVAFALTLPTRAHAQIAEVGGIAASASIDSVITGVRNALQEVISQAEAAGTVVSFRVASDAKILLQNLDTMGKELSGKVFRDLSEAQQTALNNLMVLSKETSKDLGRNIAQLDDAIKSAGEELSRIPGVSDRPFVSSYSPSYLLRQDKEFDVVVKGSLLNTDKLQMTVGQTDCKLLSSVEKTLRFSCPGTTLGKSQEWVPGALKFTKSKKWFQFWKEDENYQYQVAIRAIANEMGVYALNVTTRGTVDERIPRSAQNGHGNDHCQGGREVVWTYSPTQGCIVDMGTVNVSHSKSSNSTYNGVINLTNQGFQVRGIVRNNGQCGPFGVPKDGRGNLNVSANWLDVCTRPKLNDLPTVPGTLSWDRETVLTLPESLAKFVLRVKLANGMERIVSGAGSFGWFVVEYNDVTKILVLRPRKLEEALL